MLARKEIATRCTKLAHCFVLLSLLRHFWRELLIIFALICLSNSFGVHLASFVFLNGWQSLSLTLPLLLFSLNLCMLVKMLDIFRVGISFLSLFIRGFVVQAFVVDKILRLVVVVMAECMLSELRELRKASLTTTQKFRSRDHTIFVSIKSAQNFSNNHVCFAVVDFSILRVLSRQGMVYTIYGFDF